jgi:membrane fusion protein, multidrug efflux system
METHATGDARRQKPSSARLWRWWVALLAVCLAASAAYVVVTRSGEAKSRAARQASTAAPRGVPVVAAAARRGDVGVYLNGLGSVTPLNTITVKTRVDGELIKVLFQEGQIVKKGDLLVQIDPRPFEVQLTQAEGQMIRDQALLTNARVDLERYKVLWAQDSIPKQQLDTQEGLVHQYEGVVKLDQGQIDSARLNLVYCRLTSPIAGRVGLRLVDPGNIVHASDPTGLVMVTQLQPITVIFTLAEDSLPRVLDKLRAGQPLPVEAYDREQKRRLATGTLLTVDNQIDSATGTVRLRAQFPNTQYELFPNQFVNARLLLDTERGATVVPAAAIQRSLQGTFVFVVKADRTVEMRSVRTGVSEGDDVSILAGLSPGEEVVVDGAERLREGSRVELQARRS